MKQQTHLGYTYWFELYLMQDAYTTESWKKTLLAISQHIGFFKEWTLLINIKENSLHYYIGIDQDISALSNNFEGIVLRPTGPETVSPPTETKRESMIQFVTDGGLLDLREKYQVKRAKI